MAAPNLSGTKNLLARLGVRKPESDQKVRNDLTKLSSQLDVTRRILRENSKTINGLAKDDEKLAALVEAINDKQVVEIQKKVTTGEKISSSEASVLLDSLDSISEGISRLDQSLLETSKTDDGTEISNQLEVSLGAVVEELSTLVTNDKADMELRRATLGKIQTLVDKQDIDTRVTKDLLQVNAAELTFTKDQTDNLDTLLSSLARSTTDIKIEGTLDRIDKNLEDLALSNDQLSDALDSQDDGKSLRDRFEGGIGSKGLGFLDLVGPLVGIPGLGSLLGDAGGILAGLGAGKLLGKLGGGLGKLGGKGLGLLGKVPGLGLLGRIGGGLATTGGIAGGAATGAAAASKGGVLSRVGQGAGKILGSVTSGIQKAGSSIIGLFNKFGGALAKSGGFFLKVLGKIGPAILSFGKVALRVAGPIGLIVSGLLALKDALEPVVGFLQNRFAKFFGIGEESEAAKSRREAPKDLQLRLNLARTEAGLKPLSGDELVGITQGIADSKFSAEEGIVANVLGGLTQGKELTDKEYDTKRSEVESMVQSQAEQAKDQNSTLGQILGETRRRQDQELEARRLVEEAQADIGALDVLGASAQNLASGLTFGAIEGANFETLTNDNLQQSTGGAVSVSGGSIKSAGGAGGGGGAAPIASAAAASVPPSALKTDRRISSLSPGAQEMVKRLQGVAKDLGINDLSISESFRSSERQAFLFSQGRTRPGQVVTNAKPGQSKHQSGNAVDLFFKDSADKWDPKKFGQIAAAYKEKHGDDLLWGGDFKGSFQDMPHFQFTGDPGGTSAVAEADQKSPFVESVASVSTSQRFTSGEATSGTGAIGSASSPDTALASSAVQAGSAAGAQAAAGVVGAGVAAQAPQLTASQQAFGQADTVESFDKLFAGSFDISKELGSEKGLESFMSDIQGLVTSQIGMITSLQTAQATDSKSTAEPRTEINDIALAVQNSNL